MDIDTNNETLNCFKDNFAIYSSANMLPVEDKPSYIKSGFCGVCTAGSCIINVFESKRKITQGDIMVILPNQLVYIEGRSEDFEVVFFTLSHAFLLEVYSGICRLTVDFYSFMRINFLLRLSESNIKRFKNYISLLSVKMRNSSNHYCRETIIAWLRIFFWELFVYYQENKEKNEFNHFYTSQEKLAMEFFNLVVQDHINNRSVAFYADKMCISSKYLTMTIKDVYGKSAKELIIEYTVLEVMALLRDTTMEIKDIVMKTNFQTQSLMSRFFRKYVGLSPSEYRKQIGM